MAQEGTAVIVQIVLICVIVFFLILLIVIAKTVNSINRTPKEIVKNRLVLTRILDALRSRYQ